MNLGQEAGALQGSDGTTPPSCGRKCNRHRNKTTSTISLMCKKVRKQTANP